jgi:aryl-alcohol dehydrogenase-like predicted oxidoreductase
VRTRELGGTHLSISVVGFGTLAIAGSASGWPRSIGPQDDRDSVAAIRRAVEGGVNWIDTAAVYGYGHSEEVVGGAMLSLPPSERPYVFTKCSRRWDSASITLDDIRPQLDGSLRRLRIERVDLYQIHNPENWGPTLGDAWGVLLDLKREGKIRYAGVSNFTVDQLEACEAQGHVDALQPELSAIQRQAGETVLPWCRRHGVGVIVYGPLNQGILTGAFSAARVAALPDQDSRKNAEIWPEFHEPRLSRNLAVTAALAEVARRHGVSTPAAAVAWTLAWPGVTGAIVGARRPQQIEDWLAAETLVLTKSDFDMVALAIEEGAAGAGPSRPQELADLTVHDRASTW